MPVPTLSQIRELRARLDALEMACLCDQTKEPERLAVEAELHDMMKRYRESLRKQRRKET